jgi:hypothetical protein
MHGEAALLRGHPGELPTLLAQQATGFLKRHRHSGENVTPHPCGSVDLILASLPASRPPCHSRLPLGSEAVCAGSAAVLRPGGFLVVTKSIQCARVRRERGESTVSLCEELGLQYWQHVIALLVPIRDGSVDPPRHTRRATARADANHVGHADLLVFRKPPTPAPANQQAEAANAA